MENTKKKLPFGFYVCCLTYSFERLAYYAAKWGLTIFIAATAANGGLGLDKSVGAAMSSNLVAFTYITPIIGGYIADRWISPRILVPVGEILMGLGYLCAWKATEANGIAMGNDHSRFYRNWFLQRKRIWYQRTSLPIS